MTRLCTAIVVLLALSAAACTPIVATRGNMISDSKFARIKVGESHRADVNEIWGPPTTVSSFDGNTWYYIGETTSQRGIYAPEVKARRLIRVKFNPEDNDTVIAIDDLDPKEANDIAIVERKTPTAGQSENPFKQFIGNIGKYNPKKAKK